MNNVEITGPKAGFGNIKNKEIKPVT